jgi:hypothetical protein
MIGGFRRCPVSKILLAFRWAGQYHINGHFCSTHHQLGECPMRYACLAAALALALLLPTAPADDTKKGENTTVVVIG